MLARLLALARARPRAALIAVLAVALLLHAPSLTLGFFADDEGHQLVLGGQSIGAMRPWSLYDFGHAPAPADLAGYGGGFPWWIDADWKARFLRPVTSLTLWADHAVFGSCAAAFHAANLAWFAATLVLFWSLLRRLGTDAGVAALAILLLAVADEATMPVDWIANRNSVVEMCLTIAAVRVAVGGVPGIARVATALLLATGAALAKESGIAAFPLVACATWWRRHAAPQSVTARATWGTTAACVLLALAHVGVLVGFGYGMRCAMYVEPWHEPLTYLRRLAVLLPGAVMSRVTPLMLDIPTLAPASTVPFLIASLIVAVPVVVLVLRATRPAERWLWGAWWLLALLPQAGAPVSERLAFNAAVAAAPLLARYFARALTDSGGDSPSRRAAQHVARVLLVFTTLGSAALTIANHQGLRAMASEARSAVLAAEVDAETLAPGETRTAFVFQSPNAIAALSPVATWQRAHPDRDVRFWMLQCGRRGVRVTCRDERTLEVESLDSRWLDALFESVFLARPRGPGAPRNWEAGPFRVDVIAEDNGGPRSLRITFAEPLASPALRFLTWRDGRWRRVALPSAGASIELPAVVPTLPLLP